MTFGWPASQCASLRLPLLSVNLHLSNSFALMPSGLLDLSHLSHLVTYLSHRLVVVPAALAAAYAFPRLAYDPPLLYIPLYNVCPYLHLLVSIPMTVLCSLSLVPFVCGMQSSQALRACIHTLEEEALYSASTRMVLYDERVTGEHAVIAQDHRRIWQDHIPVGPVHQQAPIVLHVFEPLA